MLNAARDNRPLLQLHKLLSVDVVTLILVVRRLLVDVEHRLRQVDDPARLADAIIVNYVGLEHGRQFVRALKLSCSFDVLRWLYQERLLDTCAWYHALLHLRT